MSHFIIFYKDRRIDEHMFSSTEFTIGRSADNEIMLDEPQVARKHAMVKLVGNEYVLSDLGSDEGTIVNGEPIISTVLKNNDQIEIGPFRLLCHLEVFESLLQHLSSQINPATGDTDPRMAPESTDRIFTRRDMREIAAEDAGFEKTSAIAFYVGLIAVGIVTVMLVIILFFG